MKRNNFLLWFIPLLTVAAVLIDLPKNYQLRVNFGPLKIERIIRGPEINWQIGSFSLKKDFTTRLGLDLAGGTHLVLQADMKNITLEDREKAFASAKDVVERRVNLYGLTEPVVQQSKSGGEYQIVVEIPGVANVNQAIDLIGRTAQLSFHEEATPSSLTSTPSSLLALWPKKTDLTGKNLKRSEINFDQKTGKPTVALEFDNTGAKLFEEITGRNVGKTVAIFIDDQLISAPRVSEPISGGQAVIQGDFSLEEAKRLSIALNAGALPVSLKVIEQRNIGAVLGQQTLNKNLIAGSIGLFIVAAFMISNYGVLGIVADVALIIYALLTLALFKLIPVTLTLAGIAGFVLSIGMAVDANILIFERIKEEIRWGKDKATAISLGFARAFPSIKDANISSLITCAILYWFGTGMVRGFAITLALGIFVSLFSAITVTRTFIKILYQ